nr:MAG TPA: tail assembly chaperone protein [Caudoviricetes sp.]
MRQEKNITIVDGEDQYKFRLRQISAIKAEKWLIKVGVALAKAGLLNIDVEKLGVASSDAMGSITNLIAQNGFDFIGQLDPDTINELLFDLIKETAKRVTGNVISEATESELEIFTDIRALWQLQKEVFAINFSSYKNEDSSKKQA